MVLSADPVNDTISDTDDEQLRISTAHMAAEWPVNVNTGEPSYCHIFAVLSHDPLTKYSCAVASAHTAEKLSNENFFK